MKKGDKVKLVNTKGLSGYKIMKQLKKGGIYTIERIKPSGGLILEEVKHPENMFGVTQGIMKERFEVIKKKQMPRSNKRLTKPKVSSKSKRRKAHANLGCGQMNKNVSTLRRIEKANQDEKN